MQTLCGNFPVTSSRTPQPPRSATFRSSRLRLLGSPKPLGHAVQRLHGSVVRSSAATEAEPATPLVSQNAAQEVPHAEVATAEDLSAAMDKTKSGPNTNPNDQQQQQQRSPARASGGVRLGGRSKRPRTVQPEQLVPGAQFEGSVVSVLPYGAFVDIGAVTDGLVHISQLADEYVPDPNQIVHNGQAVTVKVSSWDPSKNRLSLTMKISGEGAGDAAAAPGRGYLDRQGDRQPRQGKVARAGGGESRSNTESKPLPFKIGDKLDAKVASMTGWGAFCEFGEGFRGLLHVDQMNWPEGAVSPSAYDCLKEGDDVQVYVLKVQKGNKVSLTQKTEEQRQAEDSMAKSGIGAGSSRRGTNTMQAALSSVGFKSSPKPKKTAQAAATEAPPASPTSIPAPESDTAAPPSDIPAPTAEAPADAPAATDNQATVELAKDDQSDALSRQINPKGDPTPMELPPEAQKAADATDASDSDTPASDVPAPTAAAPADAPVASDNQATVELGKNEQDEALKRQTNPRGDPTPMELPPKAQQAAEDAKQSALEGEESGEAGQGEPGTADTSNSVQVTAPKEEASAAPGEVAEGADPPAVTTQLDSTPHKESNLPEDAPQEVGEGANPEGAGGEEEKPGTGDDSATVEVTAPKEPDSPSPADIAEGDESPLEAATNASASGEAQGQQSGKAGSAADLAGAQSADALPGISAQPAQAGLTGSGSTAADTSSSPAGAGGSSASVSAVSVSEPKQETTASGGGAVSAADVKQLRQETGAGMMDCKRALTAANGDIQKATEALRKKGLAAADKKAGRIAAEGLLTQYIHAGSRLGVIVEVNCETDFVARGDVFKQLAADMAMQVAACPQVTVVDTAQVPADVVEKERNVQLGKEDIIKKPENIRGKIVDGRIQKFLAEQALLEQAFIKDTSKTVATLIKEATATVGEKISIRRFERYQLGEGLEKKESDLAADVEEQQAALQAKAAEKKTQEPAPAAQQIPDQPSVKVDAKLVKQLRDSSGAGMMECKKALANNDNNLEKATEFLRKKGLASADKKAGRMASEGAIASYVHAGSKLGVLIEVNCETDFVARGAKFKELVQDLAMQAAASPSAIVVALQDVPEAEIEKERAIEMGKEDIQSKPEAIRPKIVEGRLNKIRSQKALLEQPFIKDTGSTVAEHIKSAVASLGENIQVRRFSRYNLGEGIQKKQEDFAAEVAAQTGQ